jgi:hypothetical protein
MFITINLAGAACNILNTIIKKYEKQNFDSLPFKPKLINTGTYQKGTLLVTSTEKCARFSKFLNFNDWRVD